VAAQPLALGGDAATNRTRGAEWHAYYVFYHGDRDLLLRELVHPLVSELVRARDIDRFFFVRYALGGPHVRLRWRATSEAHAAAAEAALAQAAARFFRDWPSSTSIPEERIREANRPLLLDAMAGPADDQVYPDNSWRRFPVELEVERYGGPQRLPASLDLFTVSSALVLGWLARSGDSPARMRAAGLRIMLQMAWGLAGGDETVFLELAGYAPRLMGSEFDACSRQGDTVFGRRPSRMVEAVRLELARLTGGAGTFEPDGLAASASRLISEADGISASPSWHFGASHIHMTANRLGLTNAEEVYLSRMLWLALVALRRDEPRVWERVRAWPAFAAQARRRAQADSVASVLAELAR
jgi:hypothetical protein